MKVPPTPEETERGRADLECRRAGSALSNGGRLTRTIARRPKQFVTRAKVFAAARSEPHTLCFVSVEPKAVRTFEMATCKWTHFDPLRDRAEFELIVSRQPGGNSKSGGHFCPPLAGESSLGLLATGGSLPAEADESKQPGAQQDHSGRLRSLGSTGVRSSLRDDREDAIRSTVAV